METQTDVGGSEPSQVLAVLIPLAALGPLRLPRAPRAAPAAAPLLAEQLPRPVEVERREEQLADRGEQDGVPGGPALGGFKPPLVVKGVDQVRVEDVAEAKLQQMAMVGRSVGRRMVRVEYCVGGVGRQCTQPARPAAMCVPRLHLHQSATAHPTREVNPTLPGRSPT
jgi:hypothetical protein